MGWFLAAAPRLGRASAIVAEALTLFCPEELTQISHPIGQGAWGLNLSPSFRDQFFGSSEGWYE